MIYCIHHRYTEACQYACIHIPSDYSAYRMIHHPHQSNIDIPQYEKLVVSSVYSADCMSH